MHSTSKKQDLVSADTQKKLADLEKNLNLAFKDKNLLFKAFTHRSYLNEHPQENLESNERLEFLGDSVLSIIVSEHIFENFPDKEEGFLTALRANLISRKNLAKIAKELRLGDYLFFSHGEEESGGRRNLTLLSNTYESLLGAIFLDLGLEKAGEFVSKTVLTKIPAIIELGEIKDYKSQLQEYSQEKFRRSPSYRVLKTYGPDHNKVFIIGIYLNNKLIAQGEGKSKKDAEQNAARLALENINGSQNKTI